MTKVADKALHIWPQREAPRQFSVVKLVVDEPEGVQAILDDLKFSLHFGRACLRPQADQALDYQEIVLHPVLQLSQQHIAPVPGRPQVVHLVEPIDHRPQNGRAGLEEGDIFLPKFARLT